MYVHSVSIARLVALSVSKDDDGKHELFPLLIHTLINPPRGRLRYSTIESLQTNLRLGSLKIYKTIVLCPFQIEVGV